MFYHVVQGVMENTFELYRIMFKTRLQWWVWIFPVFDG